MKTRLLTFGFFIAVLLPSSAMAKPIRHVFEGMCVDCHLFIPQGEDPAPSLSKGADDVCRGCHVMTTVQGHPSGVSPSKSVPPEGFPVNARGEVNCITCHVPCGEIEPGNPHMLRGDLRGDMFCSNCHDNVLPEEAKHYGIGGLAHPRSTSPTGDAQIDEVSMKCLSCHGAASGAAPAAGYIRASEMGNSVSHSHPIGQSYYYAAMGSRGLRPYESIFLQMVFIEGKVGCLSCHNLYAGNEAALAVDNRMSGLCLTCHNK